MNVTRVDYVPGSLGTWRIESETNPGEFYYVQHLKFRHEHGKYVETLVCNCWPSFKALSEVMAGREVAPCKHCRQVMDSIRGRKENGPTEEG